MTSLALGDLGQLIAGSVTTGASLARFTTYRIGGPAGALVEPRSKEDIAQTLTFARDRGIPWLALGLGSNVLVSDRGFPGIVVRVGKWMAAFEQDGHTGIWRVGAGIPTPLLARRTADAGFGGVHRLIGVPGTVGGGVYMNAGAHGQEFRHVVRDVELVTARGETQNRPGETIAWAYRTSGLEEVIVTGATLSLAPDDPERLRVEISEHFRWRKAGTPFTEPCCGSVFRNPKAGPAGNGHGARPLRTAGQLLEAAGLKGFRIGGAEVSIKHANYIVNTGGATAADVRGVIEHARETVHKTFGIELRLEVRFIGEP